MKTHVIRYRNYEITPSRASFTPFNWDWVHEDYDAEVVDGDWIGSGNEGQCATLEDCINEIDEAEEENNDL